MVNKIYSCKHSKFLFLFVYIHIGRGLYFGSFKSPRTLVWSIGVIIFLVMVITAFLGYVLPFGQMSLWGMLINAPNVIYNYIYLNDNQLIYPFCLIQSLLFIKSKTRAIKRIGPHNHEILSILIGSLLGDGHLEKHGFGYRFCFQQESKFYSYLDWLKNKVLSHGYCNNKPLLITTRLKKKEKLDIYHVLKVLLFQVLSGFTMVFIIKLIPIIIMKF